MFKKGIYTIVVLVASLLTISSTSFAEGVWSDANKIGLGGYDVVAYHTVHNAVKGSKEHSVVINDTTLHFSNNENLQLFKKDPYKYLPKYDGYCAFGVGQNSVKNIPDPKTFKLYKNKLHLFFNDKFQGEVVNTMTLWNKNEEKLAAQADINWVSLR